MELVKPAHIACFGEGMIELAPDGGQALAVSFGGDVMNTAVYLSRLGGRVSFVSALGDDQYSDQLCDMLIREHISVQHITRMPGMLPGLYIIRINADGERQFDYWRETSAAKTFFNAGVPASTLESLMREHNIFYVTGITLALMNLSERASFSAQLGTFKQQGGTVVFDPNYRKKLWRSKEAAHQAFEQIAPAVSITLPSLEDETLLYGRTNPESAAQWWLDRGVNEVAVKCGKNGVLCATAQERMNVPVPAFTDPRDTTGAGDSFNAAYITARLNGGTPAESAMKGHHLAGQVIKHKGAIIAVEKMPFFQ